MQNPLLFAKLKFIIVWCKQHKRRNSHLYNIEYFPKGSIPKSLISQLYIQGDGSIKYATY